MRKDKKIKLGKLNFYIVNNNYINYLSKFDKHVANNKDEKRPYIGVVLIVEDHYYFAPMFSPKQKHKTYKDNLSFFKIINEKNKNNLGMIKFSNMIPVPQKDVYLLDVEDRSYGYKRLLSEQYSYINRTVNKKKIIEKAEKIYNIVTNNKKSKMDKFYKELSCNFKLLEEKCLEYNKIK